MIESRKPPFSRHILPFLAPSLSRLKCCSGRRLTTPRSKEIRKGPRSAHAPFPERNHPAEPSGSAAVSGKRSDPPLPALGSIGARQDGGGQALSAPAPPPVRASLWHAFWSLCFFRRRKRGRPPSSPQKEAPCFYRAVTALPPALPRRGCLLPALFPRAPSFQAHHTHRPTHARSTHRHHSRSPPPA